jgi:putative oxidoreductase
VDKADTGPKLLLPFLQPFYAAVRPLSWLIVRFAIGWNLLMHGWGKLSVVRESSTFGPTAGILKSYAALGFTPPEFWFWTSTLTETLSGIALILGLFTRFFAAAAAIELLVITILYWNNGFSWLHRGYEYVLLWGLLCFAIALRGGGPLSLDRLIGREL